MYELTKYGIDNPVAIPFKEGDKKVTRTLGKPWGNLQEASQAQLKEAFDRGHTKRIRKVEKTPAKGK